MSDLKPADIQELMRYIRKKTKNYTNVCYVKTPKVLKYKIKPLISLKYKKQAGRPHNPNVVSSSLTPATKKFTRVARDCGLLFFTIRRMRL